MIGIYDSGLGGLTVAELITRLYPMADVVFYADQQNMPLGEKTPEQIISAVDVGCRYLYGMGCELIILGCNTASAVALRTLQRRYEQEGGEIKVLGIIVPIVETSHLILQNNRHLQPVLIATPATVNSGYYLEKMTEKNTINLLQLPAVGLAQAIEENQLSAMELIINNLVTQLSQLSHPLAILACTHYIFIQPQLQHRYLEKMGRELLAINQLEGFEDKFADYCRRKNVTLKGSGLLQLLVHGSELEAVEFGQKVNKLFRQSQWSSVGPRSIILDSPVQSS